MYLLCVSNIFKHESFKLLVCVSRFCFRIKDKLFFMIEESTEQPIKRPLRRPRKEQPIEPVVQELSSNHKH